MNYQHSHIIDNNPETNEHLANIMDSLSKQGWTGRPILVNGEIALTGCHRLTACEILGIAPKTHDIRITIQWGDDNDYLLERFSNAIDDDDLLAVMEDLLVENLIDAESVEIMRKENID